MDSEARGLTAHSTQWALRAASTAIGMLCLAVSTATAASAQTADLVIAQSATPNPVGAGGTVTTTITVANLGPSAASNVAMVNWSPPNHTSRTGAGIPAGWTCTSSANIRQCAIPTLALGAVATFHPTFVVSSQTPAGLVLIDDALITSTTMDPNPANNRASVGTTVDPGGVPASVADLAVTKTGPASVPAGQSITYTIVVTNNGPSEATGVTMSEATPPDATFVSLVAPAG